MKKRLTDFYLCGIIKKRVRNQSAERRSVSAKAPDFNFAKSIVGADGRRENTGVLYPLLAACPTAGCFFMCGGIMKKLFKDALVYKDGKIHNMSAVFDGTEFSFFPGTGVSASDFTEIYDNCLILPGFCDVHVHFREPGFSYKEDIESGTDAAARGGYTAVCTMPNLNPAPDCVKNIEIQLEAIRKKAKIAVIPYGTITKGQNGNMLSDMEALACMVAGFSDDGRGVQDGTVMRQAMIEAQRTGKIIVAHCEDNSLLSGGYIHDGEYARAHSHKGISSESEWRQVARDIELAEQTGCSYHVCHVSAKESVELIRRAKARGVDINCETAPHYLVLCDLDLRRTGTA